MTAAAPLCLRPAARRPCAAALGALGLAAILLGVGCRGGVEPPPVLPMDGPRALTAQELRGQQIYLRGQSASGRPLQAMLGEGDVELPAAASACVNCHGRDGRGRPEGGVVPSDLRWARLSRPVEGGGGTRRTHPPYDDRHLIRAIAMGFDPAGNPLDLSMPRYGLGRAEALDLVVYLKRLGLELDPGLTDEALRLGTLLPLTGANGELGRAVAGALRARLGEASAAGGIYGRRLELVVADAPEPPDERRAALEGLLAEQQPFALLAPLLTGIEAEAAALAAVQEIPVVGPFARNPQEGGPSPGERPNPYVFYLYPGPQEQLRALVGFAARQERRPSAVLYEAEPPYGERASALRAQAQESGLEATFRPLGEPAQDARELAAAGVERILFAASGERAAELLAAAAGIGWRPEVLLPRDQAGPLLADASRAYAGQVLVSVPTLPRDLSPRAVDAWRSLIGRHGLSADHAPLQLTALAAAELLLAGLERAGRDLSRERLVASLETLDHFETGLTPRLGYGPNRRIGALGAYVAPLDMASGKLGPAGPWIVPDS